MTGRYLPDSTECQARSLICVELLCECPSYWLRLFHFRCHTMDGCNKRLYSNRGRWSTKKSCSIDPHNSAKFALTLCDERFWISISPLELNRNTLKARCNLMRPFSSTRWQSRLLVWPIARSNSSTRMQFSANAVSCRFFASSWLAVAMPDAQRCFGTLAITYCSELRIKWLPNILYQSVSKF